MSSAKRGEGEDIFAALRQALRQFAKERDWDQFHSPKNLAIALSVEAGELLEHYQWASGTDSAAMTPERGEQVRHEMADVVLYLIRQADILNIDLKSGFVAIKSIGDEPISYCACCRASRMAPLLTATLAHQALFMSAWHMRG